MTSKGERRLGRLLRRIFPNRTIKEQFPLKVGGRNLRVDFYLPGIGLAFEYDGRQHDKFSRFFHRTMEAFRASQQRDRDKEQGLLDIGVELIRFKAGEKISKEVLLEKISQTYS